jgi:hypothetical protein
VGGVPQVVATNRLHDDLHRIRGVLSHQIGERMATAVAAPALARFVASVARAFLNHGFRVAARAAGDGWINGRYDNHGEGVRDRCSSRRTSAAGRQGVVAVEAQKTPCHEDTASREGED